MFASREVTEEREIKAAKWRQQAAKSLKTSAAVLILIALAFAFTCIYLAGYVAGHVPDCVRPTHVSTP